MSPRLVSFAVGALVAAHAPGVWADDRAAAQLLFEQGRDLVKRGEFAAACPKLEESLRLDRGIGTMLWLADCQENAGQSASAWATFKEAAAAAALARDPREKVARDRADALAPKLSRLTIHVTNPVDGLEVKRDGVVAGRAEWDVAVPVNPGPHAIEARAPGYGAWTQTVTVPSSARAVTVEVPVLAVDPSGAAVAPEPPSAPPATADAGRGKPQRILGVGLAALGVVGVGIGTFLSLDAKSTYDDSNEPGRCGADNRCDAVGTSLRKDAMSEATLATVVIGAGLVAVVGGVVLYLTAPRSPARATFSGAGWTF